MSTFKEFLQHNYITAFDIVQAAVKANQLSAVHLTDQMYLKAVEVQLETLENIH
jgi:hypothetical protein